MEAVGRFFSPGPSKGLTVHPRVCHTLDGRNLWVYSYYLSNAVSVSIETL